MLLIGLILGFVASIMCCILGRLLRKEQLWGVSLAVFVLSFVALFTGITAGAVTQLQGLILIPAAMTAYFLTVLIVDRSMPAPPSSTNSL